MIVSWISSGQTVSDIFFAVFNGSEDLVDSATMVASGPTGGFVGFHLVPNSGSEYYAVLTEATISGRPFRRKQRYHAICLEVD